MVEFVLSFSDQPWGRVLEGSFDVGEDTRFILFAWNGQNVAWAKPSGFSGKQEVRICYHPCLDDQIQLMAGIGDMTSTDLMLNIDQVPKSGATCSFQLSIPSVLYSTVGHGVGLVAIPREHTQSRRKRLWHLRPDRISPILSLFEQAYGRKGQFVGHPFA